MMMNFPRMMMDLPRMTMDLLPQDLHRTMEVLLRDNECRQQSFDQQMFT
jgi:hypothetical protein